MYGKLYKIFGRFTLPDYADKEILHDKSEVRSIRKKHQLIGCGMVANHF